jgi:hypothetical protein
VEVVGELQRHSRAVAKAYVELVRNHIWRPFEKEGEPKSDLPQVREALDRLHLLATQSLLAVFQLVMTEVVERTMERELDRLARQGGERQRKRRRRR